jgi:phosphate uptake regulator
METRKIQKSASGTFLITLPKDWVVNTKLDEKGSVEISREEDGSLKLLSPVSAQNIPIEYTLKLDDFLDVASLERYIRTCYIRGCDIVHIISGKVIAPNWKGLIKSLTINLVGTEISEEYSNRITIRTLVDPSKFPMDTLMQRIYILVSSMHHDAVEAFKKSDKELAGDVIMREKEVEKLYRLALRQLFLAIGNKEICKGVCTRNVWDCVTGVIAARDLDRVAFYSADIAKQVVSLGDEEIDREIKSMLLDMSKIAYDMGENATQAFFKNDFMLADTVMNTIDKIRGMDVNTRMKIMGSGINPRIATALTTISRNIMRIASYAVAVAEDTHAKYILGTEIKLEDVKARVSADEVPG